MRGVRWQLILDQALPHLMKVASDLATGSQGRSAGIAAANDVRTLRDQVAELSKDQQGLAALAKDLTDQLNVITEGARATAQKAHQGITLGWVAVALSIVAIVLALVR